MVDRRVAARAGGTFFGQPRWFGMLFVVDMWERFSFYGMLAILYLYLVATPADGGLDLPRGDAAALVGTYLALVFMAALPGGWLADRVLGARRALLYGGIGIAAGHACLTVPDPAALYPGLALIVAGSGLVKPSMAAMVGQTYRGQPERREMAFSLFYMSIQVSALFAPLITGLLAERVSYHLGFGVAAVGMAVGLTHYTIGARRLGDVGRLPGNPVGPDELRRVLHRAALWGGVPAVAAAAGVASGLLPIRGVLMLLGVLVLVVPFGYLAVLLRRPGVAAVDRTRLRAFRWMLVASSVFWMLFAQGPALLNLFAKESVRRSVSGFELPASWFQSVQPLLLLVLAPVFAAIWVRLGSRVATPPKFAAGLLLGGAAFVVMAVAAGGASDGPVSPWWLVVVYLLIVCGELAIAPIGLSLAAEVAPNGFTSRVLGLFWLYAAVGVVVGGRIAALAEPLGESAYYLMLGCVGIALAGALALASRALTARLAAPAERGEGSWHKEVRC